jgi:hypothetical protein
VSPLACSGLVMDMRYGYIAESGKHLLHLELLDCHYALTESYSEPVISWQGMFRFDDCINSFFIYVYVVYLTMDSQ